MLMFVRFFNVLLQMLMDGRVSMQNVITPLSIFLLLFARWWCCCCSKLRCTYFVSGGDLMLITGNFLKHKSLLGSVLVKVTLNWLLWNSYRVLCQFASNILKGFSIFFRCTQYHVDQILTRSNEAHFYEFLWTAHLVSWPFMVKWICSTL